MDQALLIVAKLLGGAIFAVVPAFLSRGSFRRVCECNPSLVSIYVAFAIGGIGVIAWSEGVIFLRDQFSNENFGIVVIWAAMFRLLGALAILIAAVGYLVHDERGKAIGLGQSAIVTLLTLALTAPVAFVAFLMSAFLFMPHASN